MTLSQEPRPQVAWLVMVIGTIGLLLLLLPQGLGSYWGSHMIANAYLPQLGLTGQTASVDPGSVRAYVALHSAVSTLTGAGPRAVLDVLGITAALGVSLMYLLISQSLALGMRGIILLSVYVPFLLYGQVAFLTGYILGPALILSLVVIWCLLQLLQSSTGHVRLFLILAVAWLGLGPLWHSMQILTLLLAYCFTLAVHLQTGASSSLFHWHTVGYMAIVAALTWLYMRPDILEGVLTTPLGRPDLAAVFGQGNYAGPNEYASRSPLAWCAATRYTSYLCAYLLMAWAALRFVRGLVFRTPPYQSISVALIVAALSTDILFQSSYFAATGSMAPGVLLFYSIPLLLVTAVTSPKYAFGVLTEWHIHSVVLSVIVVSLAITAVDVQFRYRTEDVDTCCSIDNYAPSHRWASTHLVSTDVYSDSATSGHYQVLTAMSAHSGEGIMACGIDRLLYEHLAEAQKASQPSVSIVVNDVLWQRHLALGSLQSWNRFEPLCTDYVADSHKLARVYSDGTASVLDSVGKAMHK